MSKKTDTQPARKARVVLPIETLVDAWAMSQVEGLAKAASHYQVHSATITRAGAKIARDEALRAKAELKRQELADEWRPNAMRALRAGLDKLEHLFSQAKADQIRDVAGAVHLLAEKIIAVDAIPNVRRNLQAPRESRKATEASGSSGAGGGGERTPATTPSGTGPEPLRH